VIRSFADRTTEDIFNGSNTKAARRIPQRVWAVARRKLDVLDAAEDIRALKTPGHSLHTLERERTGQFGIKVNDQYRICFIWTSEGAVDVEITDYH
jgi:proteic killer suppression protein